jgi:hypothetical protein
MAKGVLAQRRDKPPMRAFKTWSRRAASDTCSGAGENPPILKMAERGDWALFRSIEGLWAVNLSPAGGLPAIVVPVGFTLFLPTAYALP